MFRQKLQKVTKYLFQCQTTFSSLKIKQLPRCVSSAPSSITSSNEATNLSYYHKIGDKPLVYHSLGQELERAAINFANCEAIVSCHEDKRYTYGVLFDEVNRLAAGLLRLGLQRGDYIGIWGPNTMHWYLTMLAAARAGLISVGINPAFQASELAYCLKKVNCKAVISPEKFKTQNFYEIIKSICPELADDNAKTEGIKSENLPTLKAVIIDTPGNLKGALSLNDVLGISTPETIAAINAMQHSISADSPCNVQFTSGTTGQPKAAVLSHFNIVNNGIHIGVRNQLSGQRICAQNPFFHVYGVVVTISAALSQGACIVMPAAGFDPKASLQAIVAEKCTLIHGTPTMYVDLTKAQKELNFPLKTARMALTGGAPCSPQLFQDIKTVLGLEHVRSIYGLTETTAVTFQSEPNDNWDSIIHTVGQLQDHLEVKIIDADGNLVPFGQRGELCVRGYSTMLGYYGDEEKTKETISNDKWLKTGDQFILDANGYGRIVGRLKDIIIRGGENIFPKEVEDFLNTYPSIIENHVIGVPDERMGEELCAFVRLQDSAIEFNHASVKEFAKGKISHFKVPKYLVPVDDFPKTISGKIQKFKLLELYKQLQKDGSPLVKVKTKI